MLVMLLLKTSLKSCQGRVFLALVLSFGCVASATNMWDSFNTENVVAQHPYARALEEWSNPNDKYVPSSNVKMGHKISGKEFSTSTEYFTSALLTPIALCVTGFLSIFFLNCALCCRNCFKCCRCDPNDHHNDPGHQNDSATKRMTYVNHQKMIIFAVEMFLCFAVLLADCLCYYGYGYIIKGGKDLLEALDLIGTMVDAGYDGAKSMATISGPQIQGAIALAQGTSCKPYQPINQGMTAAYDIMDTAAEAIIAAMEQIMSIMSDLKGYVSDGREYVSGYLIKYADVFVLLVFFFAAFSVVLFVLFRFCRSTIGTKFAIFWGQLTFLILLLVCLPFMIFASIMGDFCMNPSKSAVENTPDGLKSKVRFYATCVGTDEVGEQFDAAITNINSIGSEIVDVLDDACDPSQAPPGVTVSSTDIVKIQLGLNGLTAAISAIRTAAGCTKFQEIWFKIMNDAFCTNFYGGIYSLWVSQFITSFFLFFLIVSASISYHYFADTKAYITPAKDSEAEVEMQKVEYNEMDKDSEVAKSYEEVDYDKYDNTEPDSSEPQPTDSYVVAGDNAIGESEGVVIESDGQYEEL